MTRSKMSKPICQLSLLLLVLAACTSEAEDSAVPDSAPPADICTQAGQPASYADVQQDYHQ